jgi:predicted transcriptional regulator
MASQEKLWHGATMKKTTLSKRAMANTITEALGEITGPAATNRASDKFILRLPDGMRERLAEVAQRERRSMNSVALDALALYFESEDKSPGSRGYRRSAEIETAVKEAIETANRELIDKITNPLSEPCAVQGTNRSGKKPVPEPQKTTGQKIVLMTCPHKKSPGAAMRNRGHVNFLALKRGLLR